MKTEGGIYKGSLYQVHRISAAGFTLRYLDGGGVLRLQRQSLDRVTLATALVYYSVQGRTLPGRVRVYTRGSRLDARTLTATRKDLVEVE